MSSLLPILVLEAWGLILIINEVIHFQKNLVFGNVFPIFLTADAIFGSTCVLRCLWSAKYTLLYRILLWKRFHIELNPSCGHSVGF